MRSTLFHCLCFLLSASPLSATVDIISALLPFVNPFLTISLSFLHYRQFLHFKLTCCLFYPKIHYIHPFFKNKLYSTDFQNNFLDKEWVYIYNSINKWIPLKTLTGTRCKWTGKECCLLVCVCLVFFLRVKYIYYICNAKRKTALSVGTLSEVFKENTVMCSWIRVVPRILFVPLFRGAIFLCYLTGGYYMKPSFDKYIPFKQINLPDRLWFFFSFFWYRFCYFIDKICNSAIIVFVRF